MGKNKGRLTEKKPRPSSSTADEQGGGKRESEAEKQADLAKLVQMFKEKDAQKEKRIAELQSLLDDAFSELSTLCNQVRDLEKSLEFTQKEQEEVKERIQTCE